jgi:hypothetical protein
VGNMANHKMVAPIRDGPEPENMTEHHTEQLSGILQAQSTVVDAEAALHMKAVVLGMLPCHEMGRFRQSDLRAERLFPVSKEMEPWHHAILADSHAALVHEGMSFAALRVVDEHAHQTRTSWVGYMKFVAALLGSEQSSAALDFHLGSCADFVGLDAAMCSHSSYELVVEVACHPHPPPLAAWHYVYDVKHLHRKARADSHNCQNDNAHKAKLVLGCGLDCDLAVTVQLGMPDPGKGLGCTSFDVYLGLGTRGTAADVARGCKCAEWGWQAQSEHGWAPEDEAGRVRAMIASCLAIWSCCVQGLSHAVALR